MLNVKMKVDDREFICSARQAAAIQNFVEARKGGFASIKGYVSKSNYVEGAPKVSNITALTRISVLKVYARKIDVLHAMEFKDVLAVIPAESPLRELPVNDLEQVFEDRRRSELESMEKTLAGEREDARRQAHDKFYATIDIGVSVHFKSEKHASGTRLTLDTATGLPMVESIHLTYIPVNETVLVEGVYKRVNSGFPVQMGNAMSKLLPKGCKLQKASLKEDNFESIIIDGDVVVPAEIAGMFT